MHSTACAVLTQNTPGRGGTPVHGILIQRNIRATSKQQQCLPCVLPERADVSVVQPPILCA
jgi:hypothetical protein